VEGDMKVSPEKSLELFQKVLELAASAEEELQSESKESYATNLIMPAPFVASPQHHSPPPIRVFQARVLRTVLLIRLQKMYSKLFPSLFLSLLPLPPFLSYFESV